MRALRLLAAAACVAVLLASACGFAEGGAAVVACVGDSLTYGSLSNTQNEQSERAYPTVLGKLLAQSYDVRNYGVPGATLTEYGLCYRQQEACRLALEAAARVYIVMLGTNDSNLGPYWNAEAFDADLRDMVEACRRANPDAAIYLAAPPAVRITEASGLLQMDNALLGGPIRSTVHRVAEDMGAHCIDLFEETERHPEWLGADGVHLTDEGYAAIAMIVYERVAGFD